MRKKEGPGVLEHHESTQTSKDTDKEQRTEGHPSKGTPIERHVRGVGRDGSVPRPTASEVHPVRTDGSGAVGELAVGGRAEAGPRYGVPPWRTAVGGY